MIGKTISHYKIIEKLGSGGMGVVYKAKDVKLDRFVALKFLPPDLTRDDKAKKRFVNEAKAASSLQHHNICSIHEIDETDDGQIFISMDCYDGETLKEKIKRGPLELEEAVDIAMQITQGIVKAHRKGIIHRDVKPANIFITDDGVVKVLDFGLAKLTGRTKYTKTGLTMGTVAYMSPEQTRGEKVDHQTDIWSLGVVLYEMLTGQLPFKGDYEQAVIYSIINEKPVLLENLRPDLPKDIARLVNWAMAKKVEARVQNASDLLNGLKKLRGGEDVKTMPGKSRIWPKSRLKRLFLLSGMVILLCLALIVFRPVFFGDVVVAKIRIAVLPFEDHTGSEYNLMKLIQELLILKLDDSKYFDVTTSQRMNDIVKILGKNTDKIDEETGFSVCEYDGIENVVVGNIFRVEDKYITEVKVLDAGSKETIESVQTEGKGAGSIIDSQIDELYKKISGIVGLVERKGAEAQVPVVNLATASLDAFNYFIRGREEYEAWNNSEAQPYLKKAVLLDSTFALAYLYLGKSFGIQGNTEQMIVFHEKALTLSKNTPERERLYIKGTYYRFVEQDDEKSQRIFRRMANRYPKDKRVFWETGIYYHFKQMYLEAINEFEKALILDPNWGRAMNLLGYCYAFTGNFERAIEVLNQYAKISPGDVNPFDSLGDVYSYMGRFDESIKNYRRVAEINPSSLLSVLKIAYLCALKEQYSEAISWIERYLPHTPLPGYQLQGKAMKAFYSYWLGQRDRAIIEMKLAAGQADVKNKWIGANIHWVIGWIYYTMKEYTSALNHYHRAFHVLVKTPAPVLPGYSMKFYQVMSRLFYGLIDIQEGEIDSAEVRLKEIISFIPSLDSPNHDYAQFYYDFLLGSILMHQKSFSQSPPVFTKISHPKFFTDFGIYQIYNNIPIAGDLLARTYYQSGELDKAIKEYEQLIVLNPESKVRRLIHPLYYYRLGKLYEERSLGEKAVEQYERFLEIWKDADEYLSEPHDARARLARLKR